MKEKEITISLPLFLLTVCVLFLVVIYGTSAIYADAAYDSSASQILRDDGTKLAEPAEDIDEAIINDIHVDGDEVQEIALHYDDLAEEIREGLSLLPEGLKESFVENGGYINLVTLEGEKGETDIITKRKRNGQVYIDSVVINLSPVPQYIEDSIIHEFGHFAAYDMYKEAYVDEIISNYEEEVDAFIDVYCGGNEYYRYKPEYFAEMFEYSIKVSSDQQNYKDAEMIRNAINEYYQH